MEKVVKFLERHVQWLTLGLAFAYLAYMGYSYIVNAPLVATMTDPATGHGMVSLKPDQIDLAIVKGPVNSLNQAYANNEPVTVAVTDVLTDFTQKVNEDKVQVATMHGWPGGTAIGVTIMDNHNPIDKVKFLPDPIPPALFDKSTTSRTVVAGHDVAYWTGRFVISAAALRDAFKSYEKPNVPFDKLVAEFAEVKLLRQEKLPTGAWGAFTEIPAPALNAIMECPPDNPDPKDQNKEQLIFRAWMENHQDIIRQPAFFLTDPAAPRYIPPGIAMPEAPVAAAPGAAQPANLDSRVFDPARDQPRTEDERRQAQQYHKQLYDARHPARGAAPGNMRAPALAPPRPMGASAPRPAAPSPSLAPPASGAAPAPVFQPPVQRQIAGGGNAGPLNIANLKDDVVLIGHDITIEEGKVYRYAIRYKLYNPLWLTPGLADPQVSSIFSVQSPDPNAPAQLALAKVWTPEMGVEPSMHVFVNAIAPNHTESTFTIFYWEQGKWHMVTTPAVKCGDSLNVGKLNTPWSLVDIRFDPHTPQPHELYVLLMDDHGLMRHDVKSDRDSPDLAKLKAQAGVPAGAAMAR